jgi:hypothetical protein|tara:strand:+ start:484 stop:630 length:147 start_codon:yes stop_codon:yes gene_type:complete
MLINLDIDLPVEQVIAIQEKLGSTDDGLDMDMKDFIRDLIELQLPNSL